ncbi:metal-dependent transcriptional regulator [Archaeoglobus sulfaticallidus]|uniref:metal-dependent transcriptional regulator n=1 Tax=Archaeoglobus sulfaticallidus TaxID=1316941 RepID=UPI001181C098|nr:metal-dependent transcriptional regulator [Archaeoglobus sulfaticallidus]
MERVEEYLEAIYDIQESSNRLVKTTELAKKLDVKPSSVTEMILKLKDSGYVDYQPYRGVMLTKKGYDVAKRIKKYHKIFETFFTEFLGLNEEESHNLSCELEHHVSDEVAEKICMIVSSSDCKICEECDRVYYLLDGADDGEYEVLAAPTIVRNLGIAPNTIIQKVGDTVRVNDMEFELSDELKSKILVKLIRKF